MITLVDPAPNDVPGTAEAWLQQLGGPAVISIAGRDRSRCRGVSTLIHGDEPSGLLALHAWIKAGRAPATDVVATIGAVEAALLPPGFAHRYVDARRDLNRCFPGGGDDVEGALATAIFTALRSRPCEAILDLHNNSGRNPAYGLVHVLDDAHLGLVALFSTKVMKSGAYLGTLNDALTDAGALCATIECGQQHDPAAHATATAGLARFLSRERLDDAVPRFDVYQETMRVRLHHDALVGFGAAADPRADLTLYMDVDRHNFATIEPGTPLGVVGGRGAWPLIVDDEHGNDASHALFQVVDGLLVARTALIPAMMTTRLKAARGDCLCYLVERQVR